MLQSNIRGQHVSIAEVLEIRGIKLTEFEILILLLTASDHLINIGLDEEEISGLFTLNQILITSDGQVIVQFVPITEVPSEYIPPELNGTLLFSNNESRIVWCLGKCCFLCLSNEQSDIALHSLLNIMTLSHPQSRPSLQKVRQMIRNRIDVADIGKIRQLITAFYREVMGDLDELIDDEFYDDIRFSSSRSSLSIVPGPGAPDFQNDEYPVFKDTNHHIKSDLNVTGFGTSQNISHDFSSLIINDFKTNKDEKDDNASTPRAISPINSFNNKEQNSFYDIEGVKEEIVIGRKGSNILLLNLLNNNEDKLKINDEGDGNELNSLTSSFSSYQKLKQQDQIPLKLFNRGGTFQRQNSLQPERCSRQISANNTKRTRKRETVSTTLMLPTLPEFLSNRIQPSIRLRAQSMRKKKIVAALYRQEPVRVFVRLLNGHTVEVNCTSDQLVGSVFHTVAEHLDISEHLFFGLAFLNCNSESIFLEEGQYLEKWAPPGWKRNNGPVSINDQFLLHFRLRFYPKKREFVKTPTTAHQLYLQLRQDMLSGTLRFLPREKAIEMAALALCVEYAGNGVDLPSPDSLNTLQIDYFNLENYLPGKFYDLKSGEILSVQREIINLHGQFSKNFSRLGAKERFIALCLEENYYGSHFYRVHKIKPKGHRQQHNFLPDLRLIAIMPSGIGICREERNGAQRLFTSLHQWSHIRTLQFDKKRFLLGIIENGIAVDNIFYVDHHSKSGYLVRFAASQHGFMLKMRQWQGTLDRVKAVQKHRDVAIDSSIEVISKQINQNIDGLLHCQPVFSTHCRNSSQPQMGISVLNAGRQTEVDRERRDERDREVQDADEKDAMKIFIVLERHPEFGLGLTLVDGAVNGVKGVYVKSVATEGDGYRKGLLIGDCLLSIDDISLLNKTRHDAVEIVQNCGGLVRLEVLRFPSISDILSKGTSQVLINELNGDLLKSTKYLKLFISGRKQINTPNIKNAKEDETKISSARNFSSSANKSSYQTKNEINSSVPSNGKIETNNISTNVKTIVSHRQRAVSDFGAVSGLTLPTFRTDDILNDSTRLNTFKPNRYRRHKTSVGFIEPRMLESDDEDVSTDGSSTITRHSLGDESQYARGEYIIQKMPSVMAMYGEMDDNNDDVREERMEVTTNGQNNKEQDNELVNPLGLTYQRSNTTLIQSTTNVSASPFDAALRRFVRQNTNNELDNNKQLMNLDWTSDLTAFETLNNDSTLDSCSSTKLHQKEQVVNVEDFEEDTIVVTLNKNEHTPIGLSLAKRMGYEGVYIRSIGPFNSLAALDGTLRVGDKIIRVQDVELRSNESPLDVVNKLKEINDSLKLHVKRRR